MSVVIRAWADWCVHFCLSGSAGWLAYLWTWIILSGPSNSYWLGRLRSWQIVPDDHYIRLASWSAGLCAALFMHAVWDGFL